MTADNGYVTLTEFKQYLGITDTQDDDLISGFIERASRGVDAFCGRTFYPERMTKVFDTPCGRSLDMDGEDCLSIVTITNGDLGALATTEYKTYPYNTTPFWQVNLTPSSVFYWSTDSDANSQAAIQVDAIWGYRSRYSSAWINTTDLASALADTATLAVTTAEYSFVPGDIMKIDSEFMLVTESDTSGATIERAYNGTTAAAHDTSAVVYKFKFEQVVKQAVLLQATRYWKRKDAPFGVAGSGALGQVISIGAIDPDIQMLLSPVRRAF